MPTVHVDGTCFLIFLNISGFQQRTKRSQVRWEIFIIHVIAFCVLEFSFPDFLRSDAWPGVTMHRASSSHISFTRRSGQAVNYSSLI